MSKPLVNPPDDAACSFCGRLISDVKLVWGVKGFICAHCAVLAVAILDPDKTVIEPQRGRRGLVRVPQTSSNQ